MWYCLHGPEMSSARLASLASVAPGPSCAVEVMTTKPSGSAHFGGGQLQLRNSRLPASVFCGGGVACAMPCACSQLSTPCAIVSAAMTSAVEDAAADALTGVDCDEVAGCGAAEVALAVTLPAEVGADGDLVLVWVEEWHPATTSAPTTPMPSVRARMTIPLLGE